MLLRCRLHRRDLVAQQVLLPPDADLGQTYFVESSLVAVVLQADATRIEVGMIGRKVSLRGQRDPRRDTLALWPSHSDRGDRPGDRPPRARDGDGAKPDPAAADAALRPGGISPDAPDRFHDCQLRN